MTIDSKFETKVLSSLSKVFPDREIHEQTYCKGSVFMNEVFSFQIAYRWNSYMIKKVQVKVLSELKQWINLSTVNLVPSEMPCYWDHDNNVIQTSPGLYPDPLIPIDNEGITLLPNQWRSIWVQVCPAAKAPLGVYPIEVSFQSESGEVLGNAVFQLEVIDIQLPKQTLIHTEWFHTDCLATAYKLEIFSEEHWRRIGQFVETAVKHGINMILTPLFTPPLDTEIGGERPTVQLIDVETVGKTYKFGFEKLKRWVELCLNKGVEYFEFSHLFTQWGAKHAPKIMSNKNGEYQRIFGWETDAAGKLYTNFLEQFLPKLIEFILLNNLQEKVYFHISDEPNLEHLENYRKAAAVLKKYIGAYPIIDALSDFEFYETGLVINPIPSNDHIQKFLDNGVQKLWTYYCCGQYKLVSNRFFNMPSSRNRILGIQLYKFNIYGFLHWGYNFWYSQNSRYTIDPFKTTDAGNAFPSGDAFLVYPGKEGPISSIRFEVFYEALQDLRALKLLESLVGREEVIKLLEDGLDEPITFYQYPIDSQWLLMKREQINMNIKDKCHGRSKNAKEKL